MLRYGDHADQVADLRLPTAADAPAPLIVVIHGGFWRVEYDRAHTGPLAADLAARGWAVAQLEYRRTGQPGGGWPGTFADVAAGLALVPGLAAEAGPVAAGPPLLVGHSAGGHLALWAAGRARVRGVLALAPVSDLASAHRLDLDQDAVAALLGGGPDEVPHRYDYAEPAPAPEVAATVVHGTEDLQVPVAMSREFVGRRREVAGREPEGGVELVELPGVEHFALIDPRSAAWPVVVRALERLETVASRTPGLTH